MNEVYYNPEDYSQGFLNQLESNIKSDRTDLDLLFGCLLEWGLPLSLPYTSEQIDGCTVHNYNDGDLIACFDENIPDSVIKAIAKKQPLRAVFRDSSFADSPSKINVDEIFKLTAPNTRVKVIRRREMKLRFKHQKFQADAAKAVVDVFTGQPYLTPSYMMDKGYEGKTMKCLLLLTVPKH